MNMTTRHSQHGVVLIVCLLMLLLITLVATTTSQVSLMQLFMAGNDESRSEARQRALAAVDAILDDAGNTPVVGGLGYVICKTGQSCDSPIIDLAASNPNMPDLDKYPNYTVTRVAPLETTIPVMDETMANSGISYRAARFEVSAEYDDTDARGGRSTVTQGVLVKLAAGQ